MITIYVKTGCAYCAMALTALKAHSVAFEEKNIADDAVAAELITRGGKRQVPYIADGEIEMYESDDIVAYIEKTYGDSSTQAESKPRVHISKSTGVCPS